MVLLHRCGPGVTIRLRMCWLYGVAGWRVVRPSMAERRPEWFFARCGVTPIARSAATCSAASKALSDPRVILRPPRANCPTIASAASRSARPVAWAARVPTIGPCRFSISKWPM